MPKVTVKIINGGCSRRNAIAIEYCGIEKEAIPVNATTTTMIGEAIPALMAASPITKAPTMLTAEPTDLGNRSPASRNSSKKKA